jgi:hypothetical protein
MADQPDNIIIEHLRHIRRVVDKTETDVTELKSRITSLEVAMEHSPWAGSRQNEHE